MSPRLISGMKVPIYAFIILPRMTPPASIDGYEDNKNLLKYSRLVDRYEQSGSDSDRQELEAVEAKISPGRLQQYQELFRQNTELNEQLSLRRYRRDCLLGMLGGMLMLANAVWAGRQIKREEN